MTAENLFPVVDGQVKRAPISVTFEEVSDEVLDTSCNSDKPELLKKRLSIVDQLLNEDKQVLYGPLDNPQALQAYILLCCQVEYILLYVHFLSIRILQMTAQGRVGFFLHPSGSMKPMLYEMPSISAV